MKYASLKTLIRTRDQMEKMLTGSVSKNAPRNDDELVQDVADMLTQLMHNMQQLSEYILRMANGRLKQPAPSWRYMVGGSLMELNAQLLYLNWQVSQIAMGDYTQKIELSDEMSQSFEAIIAKLRAAPACGGACRGQADIV